MTIDQIKSLGKEDLLHLLGLETRRETSAYVGPALAVFSVGVLVGAGLGLMLAPRSGRALRHDISQQLHHLPETMAGLPQRAATAARRASDSLTDAVSESHHS
jgi:hypothetical protein